MNVPSDDQFDRIVSAALDTLPQDYVKRLKNVAIIYADEPTMQQRQQSNLSDNQTLLGLYEGVPLPARGGATRLIPDKITIFKLPLVAQSRTSAELAENVRYTLWHEMAHYFGLDHKRIHELE